jgi:hypothetical protein
VVNSQQVQTLLGALFFSGDLPNVGWGEERRLLAPASPGESYSALPGQEHIQPEPWRINPGGRARAIARMAPSELVTFF